MFVSEWHRLDKQIISQGQKAGKVPRLQCQVAGGAWSRTKLDQVFVPVHRELVNMEVGDCYAQESAFWKSIFPSCLPHFTFKMLTHLGYAREK